MEKYEVGQLVEMKKGHPCGANCWRIIRVGMDFRLKCTSCGRSVLMSRSHFEKKVKKIIDETDCNLLPD
jgi:hypothetical protein